MKQSSEQVLPHPLPAKDTLTLCLVPATERDVETGVLPLTEAEADAVAGGNAGSGEDGGGPPYFAPLGLPHERPIIPVMSIIW